MFNTFYGEISAFAYLPNDLILFIGTSSFFAVVCRVVYRILFCIWYTYNACYDCADDWCRLRVKCVVFELIGATGDWDKDNNRWLEHTAYCANKNSLRFAILCLFFYSSSETHIIQTEIEWEKSASEQEKKLKVGKGVWHFIAFVCMCGNFCWAKKQLERTVCT